MESGEVKVEAEDLMSRDEEVLVETNGGINGAEEGKSVLDGSISENVKVRKRGRQGKNHDGLGMESRESEGERESFRVKREKGSENGEGGVDMGENGGPLSAVEEGKVLEEDKDSLGEGLEETDVSSSAEAEKAHCSGRKEVEEGDIGWEREEGNDSERESGESEGEKENFRVKREKGSENGEGDVDMGENGGSSSAVEEGKVKEEDKDSLEEGLEETDVSSSAEAEKGHCSGRKEVEEGDFGGEREEGNDSEKEKSKVNIEGQRSRPVRMSRKLAMVKIERLSSLTYDEDEGISKRGKKRAPRKKNSNGTSNGVGDKIAQMEDEKTKQRRRDETVKKTRVGLKRDDIAQMEDEKSTERKRSLRKKGTGEGEGKELNETVTKTRVGMKRDENGFLESNMCHQCQRNDKGEVVRCTKCKTKRYCLPCMETWYAPC